MENRPELWGKYTYASSAAKPDKGKCTSANTLLDLIKDVETAVSCRKGRTGTTAGEVVFPKGKESLASVLERYKRRLSKKSAGANDNVGSGPRKIPRGGRPIFKEGKGNTQGKETPHREEEGEDGCAREIGGGIHGSGTWRNRRKERRQRRR
ncbi:hypothetical protein Scep_030223 [Stephania cephalantha]|uniref:Uncharacterized protein n=1 Tax=Stephania cephalantha TaxID=152367 RepID=A0AAP0E2R2_9MAGN